MSLVCVSRCFDWPWRSCGLGAGMCFSLFLHVLFICAVVCVCVVCFFVRGDAWAGIALPGGALVGFCSLFVGGLVVIVVFVYF